MKKLKQDNLLGFAAPFHVIDLDVIDGVDADDPLHEANFRDTHFRKKQKRKRRRINGWGYAGFEFKKRKKFYKDLRDTKKKKII